MTRSIAFAVCLFALSIGSVLAQTFPAKPLTLICPFPPSGINDQYLRTLAAAVSKYLGHPVMVENKPGANGTLGPATMAASAQPDGYSISMLPITALRVPHMQRVSWDPLKDFTYVIGLARYTLGIVVSSGSQFKSLQDLIDYAKANPGKLSYGAPGFGSTPHLAMEDLGFKTGAKFRYLPTKGTEEANNAVMEGRVLALSDSSGWAPHVDSGVFRLLVTFGERRTKWNAPTATELGVGILAYSPIGIVAPKGMDPARTKVLHDAFNRALDESSYAELLARLDMVDWYKSSEDYAEWAIDQFRFQRALIERTIGLGKN